MWLANMRIVREYDTGIECGEREREREGVI